VTDEIFTFLAREMGPFAAGALIMLLWIRQLRKDLEQVGKDLAQTRREYDALQQDRISEMEKAMTVMQQFQSLLKERQGNGT
jgi:hypothetical protein